MLVSSSNFTKKHFRQKKIIKRYMRTFIIIVVFNSSDT